MLSYFLHRVVSNEILQGNGYDSKIKDVYVAYRKAGYSKAFFEARREEITLHKAAKRAFSELGVERWFEIKGKPLNSDEMKKCEEFCRRLDNENIKYSILIGSPNLCAVRIGEFFGILEYVWEWPSEKYPDNYRIQVPKELIKEEYYSRFLKGFWVVSDKTEEEVALAASIAGKARFEYGEKPDM